MFFNNLHDVGQKWLKEPFYGSVHEEQGTKIAAQFPNVEDRYWYCLIYMHTCEHFPL